MCETLDLEQWWPELFDGMDAETRRSIVQAFAANWHEGWHPNYDDVKALCDLVRGDICEDEYNAWSLGRVHHTN